MYIVNCSVDSLNLALFFMYIYELLLYDFVKQSAKYDACLP
jgi:hypothetical protein